MPIRQISLKIGKEHLVNTWENYIFLTEIENIPEYYYFQGHSFTSTDGPQVYCGAEKHDSNYMYILFNYFYYYFYIHSIYGLLIVVM